MKKGLLITLGIIVISSIVVISNWDKIYKAILPPIPEIVSSEAYGDVVGILDYSIKVKGVVTNRGGDGTVVVEATVYQGKKDWTKTKTFYLTSYNTSSFDFDFPEASFMGNEIKYNVDVYPLGTR